MKLLSCVGLFMTPWTVAYQAPPSMGFPGQEYCSGLTCLLQGIYSEETKIEKDTRTPLFIAALFTIARTRKQPRCLWRDEWIKMLCYICTMEYYSSIKRNTSESVLMRWMNLEPIIQSEVSQKEKDKYCILKHIHRI